MKFTAGLTVASMVVTVALIPGAFDQSSAMAGTKKAKKSAVTVEAPHTKVEVDDTVRVIAPYTKVKVGKRRVKVRAPYVNIDINW